MTKDTKFRGNSNDENQNRDLLMLDLWTNCIPRANGIGRRHKIQRTIHTTTRSLPSRTTARRPGHSEIITTTDTNSPNSLSTRRTPSFLRAVLPKSQQISTNKIFYPPGGPFQKITPFHRLRSSCHEEHDRWKGVIAAIRSPEQPNSSADCGPRGRQGSRTQRQIDLQLLRHESMGGVEGFATVLQGEIKVHGTLSETERGEEGGSWEEGFCLEQLNLGVRQGVDGVGQNTDKVWTVGGGSEYRQGVDGGQLRTKLVEDKTRTGPHQKLHRLRNSTAARRID